MTDLVRWIGVPWQEGGRTRDGIDCLGITVLGARALGLPAPDPWRSVASDWSAGDYLGAVTSGFPEGWEQVPGSELIHAGDVVITPGDGPRDVPGHVWIVWTDLRLYTSAQNAGVYAQPWHRVRPSCLQRWRYTG